MVAALAPVAGPYLGMVDLVFMQSAPNFDREAANIYKEQAVPVDTDTLRRESVVFPTDGEIFGQILIPSAGIDAPMIYGDDIKNMKKGVEVYSGTYLPGQGRTVLIGGHTTTHFRTLKNVGTGRSANTSSNDCAKRVKPSSGRPAIKSRCAPTMVPTPMRSQDPKPPVMTTRPPMI